MAREVRERYHGMADVVADLRRVRSGKEPLGPDQEQALRRWQRRLLKPVPLVVMALLLMALFAGLGTRILWPPKPDYLQVRRDVFTKPTVHGKILFWGRRHSDSADALWCVDPDGQGLRQLTEGMQALCGGGWLIASNRVHGLACVASFFGSTELGKYLTDGTLPRPPETGNGVHELRVSPEGDLIVSLQQLERRQLLRCTRTDTMSNTVVREWTMMDWPSLGACLPRQMGIVYLRWPVESDQEPIIAERLPWDATNAVPFLDARVVGQRRLQSVACSRDGRRVAFSAMSGPHSRALDLWVGRIDPDGIVITNSLRRLTRNSILDTAPVFSPNGEEIVFTRSGAADGASYPHRLVVRRWDGEGGARELVVEFWHASALDWAAWEGARGHVENPPSVP
jgi:hypothetical protein